jgi:hypothetical protein
MRLVPVDLGASYLTTDDADRGHTFEFTPATAAVAAPQAR